MNICSQCGGSKIKVIKDKPYNYDECGLNVILNGLNQYECEECKEHFVSIPKVKQLHRVIGISLCKEKKGLLTAQEIKFLRKDLRFKAKELAQLLGVTPQTVSRWENNKKRIGEGQDRLLRSIYMLYASEQADKPCYGFVKMFSSLPSPRKEFTPSAINLNPPDWLSGFPPELCSA